MEKPKHKNPRYRNAIELLKLVVQVKPAKTKQELYELLKECLCVVSGNFPETVKKNKPKARVVEPHS